MFPILHLTLPYDARCIFTSPFGETTLLLPNHFTLCLPGGDRAMVLAYQWRAPLMETALELEPSDCRSCFALPYASTILSYNLPVLIASVFLHAIFVQRHHTLEGTVNL